ncbi:MAG: amino acid transporter [Psychrobium sp.]|nr:amino acid transporter [Psychrobium sp.]
MSILVAVKGFSLGLSMIMPIGAQNALVLNQGIKRNHHLTTAALCALYDIILISIGVLGGGLLIASSDLMFTLLSWGGILFLITYGAMAYKEAFEPAIEHQQPHKHKSLKMIIVTSLIVTFLNPHAYIDTIMILGSVGGQFKGEEQLYFMVGAMAASVVWFFTLAFGAAKCAKQLQKPKVKRFIDLLIACIMWLIAAGLYNSWVVRVYT